MKKLLLILLFTAFAATAYGCGAQKLEVASLYPDDDKMWEHIFDSAEPYEFTEAPFGLVLPHHSVTAGNVANIYSSLSKVTNPYVVVVIGPNHYENGEANIQTCKTCLYKTTLGDLEVKKDLAEKLVEDGVAAYNDEAFVQEHSIYTHAPFIKKYFETANILPIILKWDTPEDELKNLANWLSENVATNELVIASVDFSHYIPETMADFHDLSSETTIRNFDFENIHDLEIDSPASIYTMLYLMGEKGFMRADLIDHSNLMDFLTEYEEETTSHLYFTFSEGELVPKKGVSILAVGNLPDDNVLEFSNNWRWDAAYDESADYTTEKQLKNLRGQEDRFLVGADFLAFDLNDNECREEKQNGMKVAFCKFAEDPKKEKDYLALIKEKKNNMDLVYLQFDYQGGGELDEKRRSFVRDIAAAGVDIFVGRGLKETIPFETYKGSLLFYSLGDFVIDNQLITDLNATSAGMIVGLYVTDKEYTIYTFPLVIENGYPKLVDYSKRTVLFDIFREKASLSAKDTLDRDSGVIKIER